MASSIKTKRGRSYFAGEKRSNRVRMYAHPRDGTLFLEYRDEGGRRRNISLRHSDRDRGKDAADELAAKLRRHEEPRLRELVLEALFDNYERSVTPAKSPAKQRHDRTARALFEACWSRTAKVADLDRRDWDTFIAQRRDGRLRPPDRESSTGVRDRAIAYDLKFVMAVCNWATTVRVDGRVLLERNPFRKFPVPSETSSLRPTTSELEYQSLVKAAATMGPHVELFLFLVHETGHRSDSVAHLRWADIDLVERRVFWRKDKMKRQNSTPLLTEHVAMITRVRRLSSRIGDGWVFQSPDDPAGHVSRRQVVRWWQQLEKAATLPRVKGRGWHSLRRKFADENDDLPMSQLMALGGWRSSRTIVEIYQKPSEEKLRLGLSRRVEVREAARRRDVTTANDNQHDAVAVDPLPEVAALG